MVNKVTQAAILPHLEDKYDRVAEVSPANYFCFEATYSNLEEILKIDLEQISGLKIFHGCSTANMVVDNAEAREGIIRGRKAFI
jgi:dihydroorotase